MTAIQLRMHTGGHIYVRFCDVESIKTFDNEDSREGVVLYMKSGLKHCISKKDEMKALTVFLNDPKLNGSGINKGKPK